MDKNYKFERYDNPQFPVYSSTQNGEGVFVVPHFHKAAELIKITSGRVEIIIDTIKTECKTNDIVFIPPYSFHSARSLENGTGIKSLTFELSMLNTNATNIPIDRILNKERINEYILNYEKDLYHELSECFNKIIELYHKRIITYELDMLSLLYKLIALLIQIYYSDLAVAHTVEYNRMRPVIDYINENYNKKIYVSDLSKLLYVCDDHLIRLFKSVTNKSPFQYIVDVRIEEAMKLLINTLLPVSEISNKVGFSNANYMSRLFKSVFNMTPSEYRCKLTNGIYQPKQYEDIKC